MMSLKKVNNFKIDDIDELLDACKDFVLMHPFPKHNQLCFLNTKNHIADPDQGTGNK